MNLGIVAIALIILLYIVLFIIWWVCRRNRLPDQVTMVEERLGNLPFIHQLYVGSHRDYELIIDGKKKDIRSDSPFMVVVKNNGQFVGLIGFDIENESLLVSQLQGLRGVNVKGLNLSDFLLARAEEMATAFSLKSVRVQAARCNIYFDFEDNHPLYPRLPAHQDRLRKIYDTTPRVRGYVTTYEGDWHQKVLAQTENF